MASLFPFIFTTSARPTSTCPSAPGTLSGSRKLHLVHSDTPPGSRGSSPLTCAGLPSPATSAWSHQGQEHDTQRQQDRHEGSGSQAPSRARAWPEGRQLLLRHLGQPFHGGPLAVTGMTTCPGPAAGTEGALAVASFQQLRRGGRWCWQVGAASISSFLQGLGSCRAGDSR